MSNLLDSNHIDTEVAKVIERLARDDKAFYDAEKRQRKVPVFAYDQDGQPVRITHWQTRQVAPENMKISEAALMGLDVYIEGRGWVRGGKKAERDFIRE